MGDPAFPSSRLIVGSLLRGKHGAGPQLVGSLLDGKHRAGPQLELVDGKVGSLPPEVRLGSPAAITVP